MYIKRNVNNKYLINVLIILSFLILAIMETFIIWNKGILNGNDLYFHISRLIELTKNKTLFPRFAINSFSYNGSAVMTMYPYLLLYPFAILLRFIHNISCVIYVMSIINIFITLIVSYYSSLNMTHHRINSCLFALMYSLSYEFLSLNFWSNDVGMTFTATFLPLVLFGFIYWLKYNKWIMLSIGMSLITYSNIPMTVFIPIFLVVWLLINYKKINKTHILALIKASVLTLCSTALFILPAIKLLLFNKIYGNGKSLNEGITSVPIHSALKATLYPKETFLFNGWFPWELTIYSVFGFVLGLFLFKQLGHFMRQGYILSILILLLCSNVIPWQWHILSYLGGIFQTTIRMYLIPQVFLTYISANFVIHFMKRISINKRILIYVLIIIMILLAQVGYSYLIQDQQSSAPSHSHGIFKTRLINKPTASYINYYPGSKKSMWMVSQDKGILTDDKKKISIKRIKPLSNGSFQFDTNSNLKKISLPFLYYYGIKYNCYLNGKYIKSYPSKDQLLTIHNVPKGQHHIHINIPLTKTDVVARILTMMSVLMWIIIGVRYIKERDNVVD